MEKFEKAHFDSYSKDWLFIENSAGESEVHSFQCQSGREGASLSSIGNEKGNESKKLLNHLQQLADSSENLKIKLITTLSMSDFLSGKYLTSLKKIKNLIIEVPLESKFEKQEFIRPGFSWNRFMLNLKFLFEMGERKRTKLLIPVSAYNLFYLVPTIRYLDFMEIHRNDNIRVVILDKPSSLSLNTLPLKLIKNSAYMLGKFIKEVKVNRLRFSNELMSELKDVLDLICSEKVTPGESLDENFKAHVSEIESKSHQNFKSSFPELAAYL